MKTNPDKALIKAVLQVTAMKHGSKTGKLKKKHLNKVRKEGLK